MSLTREQWDLQFPNDPLPTYLGIDGQFIPERYIPFDTTNLKTHDVIVSEDGQYLMYFKEDKSYKIYDQSPFKFLVNPFKEWKKFGYELPVDDIKKSAVEYFKPLQEEFNKKLNEAWKDASQATRGNDMVITEKFKQIPDKLGFRDPEKLLKLVPKNPLDDKYFTPSIEDIKTKTMNNFYISINNKPFEKVASTEEDKLDLCFQAQKENGSQITFTLSDGQVVAFKFLKENE